MRTAIIAFKYEGEFARSRHLSELLLPLAASCSLETVLAPVPLHPERERSRGYNQSRKLAQDLSVVCGLDVSPMLQRTVATRQQTRLTAVERARNVKGAFLVVNPGVATGKRIVLVDDVMTTGSTLGECAESLKACGAIWVGAITVARER